MSQRLERGELPIPRVAKSKDQFSDAEVIGRCREIARVFATTERWLREDNLGTFGHMITRAHELLTSDETLLAAERARARFILVDEFQDANFAQIKILAALAGTKRTFLPLAIRIRPSTAFVEHPAQRFICFAAIFLRPSWSSWARTGARRLRFCSAHLP